MLNSLIRHARYLCHHPNSCHHIAALSCLLLFWGFCIWAGSGSLSTSTVCANLYLNVGQFSAQWLGLKAKQSRCFTSMTRRLTRNEYLTRLNNTTLFFVCLTPSSFLFTLHSIHFIRGGFCTAKLRIMQSHPMAASGYFLDECILYGVGKPTSQPKRRPLGLAASCAILPHILPSWAIHAIQSTRSDQIALGAMWLVDSVLQEQPNSRCSPSDPNPCVLASSSFIIAVP